MQLFKKILVVTSLFLSFCGIVVADSSEPFDVIAVEDAARDNMIPAEAVERCDIIPVIEDRCDIPVLLNDEFCQDPTRWWVNFGVGVGGNLSDSPKVGPAVHYSFNGTFTPHMLLTIYRNGFHTQKNDEYGNYAGQNLDKDYYDIGILLGYVEKCQKSFWSLSAGLGYQSIYEEHYQPKVSTPFYWRDAYTYSIEEHQIALPIQAQAFWTPFKHFGVGVIGHAVLSKDPCLNVMLAIQVL